MALEWKIERLPFCVISAQKSGNREFSDVLDDAQGGRDNAENVG